MIVAVVGAVLILCGIVATIAQLVVSIRTAGQPARPHGRSLERPHAGMVHRLTAALLELRRVTAVDRTTPSGPRSTRGRRYGRQGTTSPLRCHNSANGFITAFFAVVAGFALIWHIWWLAISGWPVPPSFWSASAGASVTRIEVSAENWPRRARPARAQESDGMSAVGSDGLLGALPIERFAATAAPRPSASSSDMASGSSCSATS